MSHLDRLDVLDADANPLQTVEDGGERIERRRRALPEPRPQRLERPVGVARVVLLYTLGLGQRETNKGA